MGDEYDLTYPRLLIVLFGIETPLVFAQWNGMQLLIVLFGIETSFGAALLGFGFGLLIVLFGIETWPAGAFFKASL